MAIRFIAIFIPIIAVWSNFLRKHDYTPFESVYALLNLIEIREIDQDEKLIRIITFSE